MINSSYYTLITEQKNDILINLKVIGKIGPGDKINTKKKHFDKDNTSWYQPFLRLYRGDSRECSINQVNCLINEANNLITVAIKSKQTFRLHPFGGTQDTENRRTPPRRGGGTFGYTPSGVHTENRRTPSGVHHITSETDEFFYKNFSPKEFLKMLWGERIIHNALTGIENLKDTYNNDSNITSRLECLITILRKNIIELEKEIKSMDNTDPVSVPRCDPPPLQRNTQSLSPQTEPVGSLREDIWKRSEIIEENESESVISPQNASFMKEIDEMIR